MVLRDIEEEIVKLRVQNQQKSQKLQEIYTEIDNFMAKYYQIVGDLCLKISELEEKQKIYQKKIRDEKTSSEPNLETGLIAGYNQIQPRNAGNFTNSNIDKEAKALHRKLIKITHPDVSEEKLKAAEYTRMVNEAYNQKNYLQLVKLDQLINSGKATEKDLIKQRNKLIDSTFDLKIQLEQTSENPIYRLLQKFKSQEDQGEYMLNQIKENLALRVEKEKRKLMDLKIQYLEKMKEKITA